MSVAKGESLPSGENVKGVEPSSKVIVIGWIVISLFFLLLMLSTAPLGALLGEGVWAIASAIHGMLAILGMVILTIAGYLGWRLYIGKLSSFSDLRILAFLSSIVSIATIIFGNWTYIAYRLPDGPRAFFLANNPEIHEIFFEFKEFIGLFTLPLAVAAAYIAWTYSDSLEEDRQLRTSLAVMIAILWMLFMLTFVLGAAITKLRSV